jgi:membrane associated rhomboid family serine protease
VIWRWWWRDHPLTTALIAAQLLVSVLHAQPQLSLVQSALWDGQWWRLLGHAIIAHSSSESMVDIGLLLLVMSRLERRIGTIPALATWLVCSLTGALVALATQTVAYGPSMALAGALALLGGRAHGLLLRRPLRIVEHGDVLMLIVVLPLLIAIRPLFGGSSVLAIAAGALAGGLMIELSRLPLAIRRPLHRTATAVVLFLALLSCWNPWNPDFFSARAEISLAQRVPSCSSKRASSDTTWLPGWPSNSPRCSGIAMLRAQPACARLPSLLAISRLQHRWISHGSKLP